MRHIAPRIGLKTAILLALVLGGGAVTAGIVLPPQASDTAREATADVVTGNTTHVDTQGNGGGFVQGLPEDASITADIRSAFGQCVSEQAKTSSEQDHPGFNPTDACAGLRNSNGQTEEHPDHPTGLDRAEERSDGNAGGQGQSQGASEQGGGNGPANANPNGADNASAREENANH